MIKRKISQRIKILRAKAQISQEELAYRADLDRTYINSVENGKRNISIVNIEKSPPLLNIQ
jgi:transcriptional regulator with XRE-family HTH domain